MKGRRKQEIPEKTRRPAALSGTTAGNRTRFAKVGDFELRVSRERRYYGDAWQDLPAWQSTLRVSPDSIGFLHFWPRIAGAIKPPVYNRLHCYALQVRHRHYAQGFELACSVRVVLHMQFERQSGGLLNYATNEKVLRFLSRGRTHSLIGCGETGRMCGWLLRAARNYQLVGERTGFDSRRGRSQMFASENRAARCRWSAGFLVDLPFPSPVYSGAAPNSPRFTSTGFLDLDSGPALMRGALPCRQSIREEMLVLGGGGGLQLCEGCAVVAIGTTSIVKSVEVACRAECWCSSAYWSLSCVFIGCCPAPGSYGIRKVFPCRSAIGSEACRAGLINCDPIAKVHSGLFRGCRGHATPLTHWFRRPCSDVYINVLFIVRTRSCPPYTSVVRLSGGHLIFNQSQDKFFLSAYCHALQLAPGGGLALLGVTHLDPSLSRECRSRCLVAPLLGIPGEACLRHSPSPTPLQKPPGGAGIFWALGHFGATRELAKFLDEGLRPINTSHDGLRSVFGGGHLASTQAKLGARRRRRARTLFFPPRQSCLITSEGYIAPQTLESARRAKPVWRGGDAQNEPAGPLPDYFRKWESCQTMSLVSRVFSGVSRSPPRPCIPPSAPHPHLFNLVGSQDFDSSLQVIELANFPGPLAITVPLVSVFPLIIVLLVLDTRDTPAVLCNVYYWLAVCQWGPRLGSARLAREAVTLPPSTTRNPLSLPGFHPLTIPGFHPLIAVTSVAISACLSPAFFREQRHCNNGTTLSPLLASHQGEPGSIPGRLTRGLSHVVVVPDDAAGRRVFSGVSRFVPPFHSGAAPHSPQSHPRRLSSQLLRAAQISFVRSIDQRLNKMMRPVAIIIDKIDFRCMHTEVTSPIGSEFIMHALDDSEPIAILQGTKKRIPYGQVWGSSE
ncbi:hypothetical protein PR048_024528 [Dryococelus australis]|uniref:Uncharacterized protein n=1 Tax=Dryococelus australis TaxID=614101 RepID=A0ABQ9GNV5_9NEOP|nr:hypothetical protein PR048_024528 [Dryococelus australis]